MELKIPDEPVELKKKALTEADFLKGNLFAPSGLPKYLWKHWNSELKAKGLRWPLFLKALSACKYDINLWVEGRKSWKDLVQNGLIPVLKKALEGKYPLWPP